MSPARRFRVALLFNRMITLELNARTAEAAEAIAHYVYDRYGDRSFDSPPEEIVDTLVDDLGEAQA